jgi:hypothetical protein
MLMTRLPRSFARFRRAVALPAALMLLVASVQPAYAYRQNIYDPANDNTQARGCWCVVASARTTLQYMDPSFSISQSKLNRYMTTKDKYDWTDPSQPQFACADGSYGHDGRGWSWTLYRYAPGARSFNDYRSSSRADQDWEIVKGIRATGAPVGVIAAAGMHAINVVGYRTLHDPFTVNRRRRTDPGSPVRPVLYGFFVVDPWRGRGNSGMRDWPFNGFAPNSYIDIGDWDSRYFLKDIYEGRYYYGKWVTILRKAEAGPPDNDPGQTYGDLAYQQAVGGAAVSGDDVVAASAPSAPTIAQAIEQGIRHHGLLRDATLGVDLGGYSVGRALHVRSLAPDIASYSLAEVRVSGVLRAVALVTQTSSGYRFGALTPSGDVTGLPSQSELDAVLSANGMRGPARLVWGWTPSAAPPFAPFVAGTDRATGRSVYLTGQGRLEPTEVPRRLAPQD